MPKRLSPFPAHRRWYAGHRDLNRGRPIEIVHPEDVADIATRIDGDGWECELREVAPRLAVGLEDNLIRTTQAEELNQEDARHRERHRVPQAIRDNDIAWNSPRPASSS